MSTGGFHGTFIHFTTNEAKFNPKVKNQWLKGPTVDCWQSWDSNRQTSDYSYKTLTAELPQNLGMEAILLTLTCTRTGQPYFCKLTSNSSGNSNSLREVMWRNSGLIKSKREVTSRQISPAEKKEQPSALSRERRRVGGGIKGILMDMARINQIKVNDTVSAAQHDAVHQCDVHFSASFGNERLYFSHFSFLLFLSQFSVGLNDSTGVVIRKAGRKTAACVFRRVRVFH